MNAIGSISSAFQPVFQVGSYGQKGGAFSAPTRTRDGDGDGDRSPPGEVDGKGGKVDTYA